jgi:N-acetylglucosaminyldiphosphoundecaprenol N-acetyl-beta-D-mannosaminyltransferase
MESIYNFTYCGLEVSSIADPKQLEEYFLNIWDMPNSKSSVFGYSMSIYPRLKENPDLYTYSSAYDLIVSDGVKFHKLGQRFGFPFKYMISIPQTVLFVLDLARKYNKTVMLVGATEDVLRAAEKKLKESKITILPGLNGYFTKDDEENVVNHINNYNPDILLLGMPTPKKEKFNYDYKTIIDAKVILLCGGMIDVIAEKSKLSSPFIKKLGLAGIYRAIQEPSRLFKRILKLHSKIVFYYFPKLYFEFIIKKNRTFSIVKHP